MTLGWRVLETSSGNRYQNGCWREREKGEVMHKNPPGVNEDTDLNAGAPMLGEDLHSWLLCLRQRNPIKQLLTCQEHEVAVNEPRGGGNPSSVTTPC